MIFRQLFDPERSTFTYLPRKLVLTARIREAVPASRGCGPLPVPS